MWDTATEAIEPLVMRAQLRVGRVLREKWRLDVLLGIGGMAAVYAATHRTGSRVAIKILHSDLSAYTDLRSRFLREAYIANQVNHPSVVRVIDDDVDDEGSLFFVMDLLDGETLEERRLRHGGRLDVDEVLAAVDPLLDALIAAHEKGVVHRDVKPENIFLTRDGSVKVLDFGIARLRELASPTAGTRTGVTLGTPAYMSPEHARGRWEEVDAQSDIFSVGATMFAAIVGRVVHEARNANEQLLSAMTERATSLTSVVPDVPRVVAALVDRALAFDKANRWPDARAMQDVLRLAYHELHDKPLSSHPPLSVPASVPNRTLPSAGIVVPASLDFGGYPGARRARRASSRRRCGRPA